MTVTIKDVARKLNLSITTVSRALDGYADVAEETRTRVQLAARELGYMPNRSARQLRRKRAETIGFILPTSTPRFSDPFFAEFISGLGDGLAQENYDLLVSMAPPGEEAERQAYQKWVQGMRVDGFVLNRMHLHDWRVQYLGEHLVPFVALERTLDPVSFNFIEVDGQAGLMKMIHHLVEMGHRRIAFVGGPPHLTLQANRFAGYRAGLVDAGIPLLPELVVEADLTRAGGYHAGLHLLQLQQPPTAIACVNDLTAVGVVHAASERGLRVGPELAVSGFDGVDESEHSNPPITTLSQPVYDIARRLVRMLIQELSDETPDERQVRLVPELVVRDSTRLSK
jgi:LacI family transcriptional regulator